jgi:hypothetical protein
MLSGVHPKYRRGPLPATQAGEAPPTRRPQGNVTSPLDMEKWLDVGALLVQGPGGRAPEPPVPPPHMPRDPPLPLVFDLTLGTAQCRVHAPPWRSTAPEQGCSGNLQRHFDFISGWMALVPPTSPLEHHDTHVMTALLQDWQCRQQRQKLVMPVVQGTYRQTP